MVGTVDNYLVFLRFIIRLENIRLQRNKVVGKIINGLVVIFWLLLVSPTECEVIDEVVIVVEGSDVFSERISKEGE